MQQIKQRKWLVPVQAMAVSGIAMAMGMLALTAPASAKTYYVKPSGPYQTEAAAQNPATPTSFNRVYQFYVGGGSSTDGGNDTIVFQPGTYTLQDIGKIGNTGMIFIQKSNLTIKAQNPAVNLDGTTVAAASRSIIKSKLGDGTPGNPGDAAQTNDGKGFYLAIGVSGVSNVTVTGFEINGAETNLESLVNANDREFTGLAARSGAHHVYFKQNLVHDVSGGGIVSTVDRGTNNIALNATDYIRIENNIIYNTCFWDKFQPSGISLLHSVNSDGGTGFHSWIRNNRVYNNRSKFTGVSKQGDAYHTDGNGIAIDTNSGNNSSARPFKNWKDLNGNAIPKTLIENNVVYKNGGAGIHVFHSANVTVRNNSTYDNAQDLNFQYPSDEIDSAASKDCLYTNNVAYQASRSVVPVYQAYGRTGSGTVADPYIYLAPTSTWRNNTHYNGTTGGYISMGGASETAMYSRDPHYFDAAGGNLKLGNFFPAAGIDVGSATAGDYSPTDFLGIARPQLGGVDRGAYERAPSGAQALASGSSS